MIKNVLFCLVLGCAIVGCSGGSQPDLNTGQEKQANDLASLRQKANGNFDNLSDADKKALIQIAGSEQGARMMVVKHGAGPRPGGGPAAGRPGGQ